MSSCATCGGFIGEPGKAYGYAGKWCHCWSRPSIGRIVDLIPQQPIQRPPAIDYSKLRQAALSAFMKPRFRRRNGAWQLEVMGKLYIGTTPQVAWGAYTAALNVFNRLAVCESPHAALDWRLYAAQNHQTVAQ